MLKTEQQWNAVIINNPIMLLFTFNFFFFFKNEYFVSFIETTTHTQKNAQVLSVISGALSAGVVSPKISFKILINYQHWNF